MSEEESGEGYIRKIQIMTEGWCRGCDGKKINHAEGAISLGIGKDVLRLATGYGSSVDGSFRTLRQMIEGVPEEVVLTAFRKVGCLEGQGLWNDTPGHRKMAETLIREVQGRSNVVNKLTALAALGIYFRGKEMDLSGPAGVFLVNFFTNAAPFLASRAHRGSFSGQGHLSVYKNTAAADRLSDPKRWFTSQAEMTACVGSLAKFSLSKDVEVLSSQSGKMVSVESDHLLWFAQPGFDEQGSYFKLQYLHSMPLHYAQLFVREAVSVTEYLLEWFFQQNKGQPVVSKEQSQSAFTYVSERTDFTFPKQPLGDGEWQYLVSNQ